MENKLTEDSSVFDDPMIMQALNQAMQEVIEEESIGNNVFNKDTDGVSGYEDNDGFHLEQDIKEILDDAQMERDMRNDGLMVPEKGTRKFATVPVGVMIEYANKTA